MSAAAVRERMDFNVVIVGAGPAGLAAAIRLRQLAEAAGTDLSVVVLEKGSEVGAHILSGAVIDRIGLDRLLPDWRERGAPVTQEVTDDRFLYLTERRAIRLPTALLPRFMSNHGNYIVSLGDVVRWLGEQAEAIGAEIYPGFPATEVLTDTSGAVTGVATGDMGIHRDGTLGPNFTRGMELRGKYTLIAEGARGSSQSSSSAASGSTPAASRKNTGSASRSCGRSRRGSIAPASPSIPSAGRSTTAAAAARSSTTPGTISSPSASSFT